MTFYIDKDKCKALLNISPGAWMANDAQPMPIMRTYPHCLKADSVQVTFGEQETTKYEHVTYGVLSDGTIGSVTPDNPLKNFAREYNKRMGLEPWDYLS